MYVYGFRRSFVRLRVYSDNLFLSFESWIKFNLVLLFSLNVSKLEIHLYESGINSQLVLIYSAVYHIK